jgi:hypothetical protein
MPTAKPNSGAKPRASAKTAATTAPKEPKPRKPAVPPPPPTGDFAKDQIARLQPILDILFEQAASGELAAVDRLMKVLDRIDRYHGYLPSKEQVEDEEDIRAKILQKLSEVDARRAAARQMIAAGELPDVRVGG